MDETVVKSPYATEDNLRKGNIIGDHTRRVINDIAQFKYAVLLEATSSIIDPLSPDKTSCKEAADWVNGYANTLVVGQFQRAYEMAWATDLETLKNKAQNTNQAGANGETVN